MERAVIFFLCSFVVGVARGMVTLEPDIPYLNRPVSSETVLKCCYKGQSLPHRWIKNRNGTSFYINYPDLVKSEGWEPPCHTLKFKSIQLNDTGLYRCQLNDSNIPIYTHGTYLHVYEPLEKTINLSESTKNKILTAEGLLLLLCVILPSASLLCKSKRLSELEKKKMKTEDENIYQGLNLDDCCATYDQIERSQGHGPYQDVCNIIEEEEEIQLEKP